MKQEILSPFDGEPQTEPFTDDDGNPAFRIKTQTLTPEGVKRSEFWAGLSVLLLMGMGFYLLAQNPHAPAVAWFALLIGPPFAYRFFEKFWAYSYIQQTEMVMTINQFRIKRGNQWQLFDRTLAHKFKLFDHDKTRDEKDANEFAVRKAQARGQVIAPKRYYGDSFHVVFEYLNQRNDIITVYGRNEAAAIVTRLRDCDDRLNQLSGMGDGATLNPDDQWSKGPGEI
ncbi:MAG: hypothetical protein ABW127_00170 [Candidatus Thiodiazotropha endolucinida]